jgi:molybdopterin-binding protein
MNVLKGHIEKLEIDGKLSLVFVRIADLLLQAIVIDTPSTNPKLAIANPVSLVFKETEAIVGSGDELAVSLVNKIPAAVRSIDQGKLLSKVTMDSEAGEIKATVTSQSIQELELKTGGSVTVMVKTNEMMLAYD